MTVRLRLGAAVGGAAWPRALTALASNVRSLDVAASRVRRIVNAACRRDFIDGAPHTYSSILFQFAVRGCFARGLAPDLPRPENLARPSIDHAFGGLASTADLKSLHHKRRVRHKAVLES